MQITPSVHALRHVFHVPVAPGIAINRFVYSYLICGETVTLIDTGVAGSERVIYDYLRSVGFNPGEISLIILTHSHPDHIGAARRIREDTGCSIAANPAERLWIEDVACQSRERPVPGFDTLVGGPVPLEFELNEGDTIDPDGTETLEIQVLHTPGHSAGSISLFLHNEGVLFSGDVIPVPGDLPVYDDALLSVQSVKRLRTLRGIQVLLSSWDEARRGEDAYRQMGLSLDYLAKIHAVVLSSAGEGSTDPMELTRSAAAALCLPPQMVNPLLARTFSANLRVRHIPDLLSGRSA
jgi:glyoxylase-like metal-dependent hydrolase (beta-lactamase superfamily II)